MADLAILQTAASAAGRPSTFELEEPGRRESLRLPPQQVSAPSPDYDVPNGGYGWVCALSVFLINAHTWGVNAVCF